MVWCITVPHGAFIARRNGLIFATGNSGFPKSLDVSKAIDKAAGVEREVVGIHLRSGNRGATQGASNGGAQGGYNLTGEAPLTAPATPDAERWQGWGTALKPAFEPIVVARKPLAAPGINVLEIVESGLINQGVKGAIRWATKPASGAASQSPMPTSGSTSQQPTAATSARNASASATPYTESATASATATSTASGEPQTPTRSRITAETPTGDSATPSSMPTAPTASAVAKQSRRSSRSTTSTEAAPSTESQSTERSTPNSAAKDSPTATGSFAGIATGLTGSWATVRIDRLADGTFVWPDGLPRTTAGKSTVAANVLEHGTGALNIDGCRVGTSGGGNTCPGGDLCKCVTDGTSYSPTKHPVRREGEFGRWPTNVALDGTQADELDGQSGERPAGGKVTGRQNARTGDNGIYGAFGAVENSPYDDTGGASRFFPTFRYEAKASRSERPRVNGTAHPTVKPIDLMRWLVRLVTPPGGTVLEPFAGSGTTVEACIIEGFRCIAIERETDYLPLIEQRIHRRRDPVAAIRLAGDDLGLFDSDARRLSQGVLDFGEDAS